MRRPPAPLVVASACVAFGLTLRATVRRYIIVEHSMRPALEPRDWVLATRSSWPARGDVVVFDHPHRPGYTLVKRIVGLPGETITIRDGAVFVDGRTIDEPWAGGPTHPGGEWHLGADEVFVLSDARTLTLADSRTFGPISRPRGAFTVRARYWPAGRIGPVR